MLDVVWKRLGQAAVDDLLSDLARATPNRNHRFFAEHLARGGSHITANFDTCIERAVPNGARPIHFHGVFGPHGDTSGLGIRLAKIETGFPEALLDELLGAVARADPRAIVFAGYSGSDYFDVLPLFRKWGRELFEGRTVYWVSWRPTDDGAHVGEAPDSPTYLRIAAAAGASIVELRMPLVPILDHLSTAWKLPQPPIAPAVAPPNSWTQEFFPTAGAARQASFALLATVGARKQALPYFSAEQASSEDHRLMADVFWGRGQFRQARRHWGQAMSHPGASPSYELRERVAAVEWVRGRYRKAERDLWDLLSEIRAGANPDRRMLERVAETYARVVGQMLRMPDIRGRVRQSRVDDVMALLADAQTRDERRSVGLSAKLQSAWADLARVANSGPLQAQSIAYAETESLHGMLNHRQGMVRADATKALQDGKPLPPANEYRELFRQNLVLGARGDAARVPMIPGSEHAFTIPFVAKALWQVQFTPWQRIRVLADFASRRLRR